MTARHAAVALVMMVVLAGAVAAQDLPVTIKRADNNRRVAEKVEQIVADEAPRIAAELGIDRIAPFEIRIEDDITPYRERLGRRLPEWGVAFAVLEDQVIVVDVKRATRAMNSLEHVIPHELSHLLLAQRAPRVRFPIWFLEGLAKWQAREWSMIDSWQLMNSVWSNEAPSLLHLVDTYPTHEEPARTAYRLSYTAFTDLIAERPGEPAAFLDAVVEFGNFDQAFHEHFGYDVSSFALDFHDRLERRYHSRLLVFQTGPLFSVMAVVFLAVGLRFYLRKKRRLREMGRLEEGDPLA
jgi:hypothetical protein